MNQNARVPPSYVPTLTEVVHDQAQVPVKAEVASQTALQELDVDALTERVLQHIMPQLTLRLEERLREHLFQWADEQATALFGDTSRILGTGLEPIVRDALAQSLLVTSHKDQ